jgi:hypothetical protein
MNRIFNKRVLINELNKRFAKEFECRYVKNKRADAIYTNKLRMGNFSSIDDFFERKIKTDGGQGVGIKSKIRVLDFIKQN